MSSFDVRTVFVTVGTTLFQDLVDEITSQDALDSLRRLGCTKLVIQYGKGSPPSVKYSGIDIQSYDFKPSLLPAMKEADLIVSHAGAGTIMEVARLGTKTAVVVNSKLMHNHQSELANAMGSLGYIHIVTSPDLLRNQSTWDEINAFQPVPYECGDSQEFPRVIDEFIGPTEKVE